MKKKIAAIMFLIMLGTLAGCSKEKKEDRVIDVHTMAQSLLNDNKKLVIINEADHDFTNMLDEFISLPINYFKD